MFDGGDDDDFMFGGSFGPGPETWKEGIVFLVIGLVCLAIYCCIDYFLIKGK